MPYGRTCCNQLSAGSALARRLQNVVAARRRITEFSSILLLLFHQILLAVCYYCHVATDPESLGVLTVLNSQPFQRVAARQHSGLLRLRPRSGNAPSRRPVFLSYIVEPLQNYRRAVTGLLQSYRSPSTRWRDTVIIPAQR